MRKKCPIIYFTIIVWMFIVSVSPLLSVCSADFSLFTQLRMPLGVATDNKGNVFIHADRVSDHGVFVYSPIGDLKSYIKLGGFTDVEGFSHLTIRRSDGL